MRAKERVHVKEVCDKRMSSSVTESIYTCNVLMLQCNVLANQVMDGIKVFDSRRTPVFGKNGAVSTNQPLAAKAGIDILELGGNAADAAVAVAAALAVTEPMSTGLGGDAFCLFYNNKSVKGINGSGRCPEKLTLQLLEKEGFNNENPLPFTHIHNVTVPGTVAAWVDTLENFGSGKVSMAQILAPAVALAEHGFPVSPIASHFWTKSEKLLQSRPNGHELLKEGRAPHMAQVITLPNMATILKDIGERGKAAFYEGWVADAIVEQMELNGGVMTLNDLAKHTSTLVDPISTDYKDCNIWEIPPNGLGITTLLALNILDTFDLKELGFNSPEYYHVLIEALKISFADTLYFVADSSTNHVPIEGLLSKEYALKRRSLISMDKANNYLIHGEPDVKPGADTVYLTVADKDGNACSFINSVYMAFGTGYVPKGCGFALHNRGALFSLDATQPNALAPGKRPQHTIIPVMVTDKHSGQLLASYGIMGGYMQPQAQVQVLLGMMEFGLDPQQALNLPRFCVNVETKQPWVVKLEQEVPEEVRTALQEKGHTLEWPVEGYDRSVFGRGHVIARAPLFAKDKYNTDEQVWWTAADPRCDGYPLVY